MDRVREDVEAVVEEEDEEEYDEREDAELDGSTNLRRVLVCSEGNLASRHTILRVIFGGALDSLVFCPSPLSELPCSGAS